MAPDALKGELEDQLVEALAYRDDDAEEYLATVEEHAHTERPTVLCHLAHARAMAGAPRSEVLPAWRRAFADARVFARLGVERFAALWAIEALLAVEAADEAKEATRAMTDLTDRAGSRSSAGAAAWMEARWERRFGHLRRAEDLARHGLELARGVHDPGDWRSARRSRASCSTAATSPAPARRWPRIPEPGPTASIFGVWAVHARLAARRRRPRGGARGARAPGGRRQRPRAG